VQVEREVVPAAAHRSRDREIGADAAQAARARRHQHFVDVRVQSHDRRGGRLDQVRHPGRRVCLLQCPGQRRGEDHVADEP
jgi:hypothetical protein